MNFFAFDRILSEKPHLAATEQDEVLAVLLRDRFLEYGFDWAEMMPYDLLLSRPNSSDPNLVRKAITVTKLWRKQNDTYKTSLIK